jgi:heme A synthase
MTLIRRLAWLSLLLGFGQIVFGAIVRITGSGMGCGDHWPKCQGHWFPPLDRLDLIIEVSHRYVAATLTASIIALVAASWRRRDVAGVSGAGGVLRPSMLAALLVVAAAFFGAITVWLELANKLVIVTHLSIAMSLLAALTAAILRSGGPPRVPIYGAATEHPSPIHRRSHPHNAWAVSAPSAQLCSVAAVLAFGIIVLGALTANVPGANTACRGFPLCEGGLLPTDASQYLQFIHRLGAFALFGLVGWMGVAFTRRGERRLAAAARLALTLIFAQLVVAAVMIDLALPPLWRSLHEAIGTLLWIVLFGLAYAARRAAGAGAAAPNESALHVRAAGARV